jgi:hypothetical protein
MKTAPLPGIWRGRPGIGNHKQRHLGGQRHPQEREGALGDAVQETPPALSGVSVGQGRGDTIINFNIGFGIHGGYGFIWRLIPKDFQYGSSR